MVIVLGNPFSEVRESSNDKSLTFTERFSKQ